MGFPLVYPTGVTIYNPDKAYNGYTLMSIRGVGAALMDMNGNMLRIWKDLQGMPNKLLKGGYVMGHLGIRDAAYGYRIIRISYRLIGMAMSFGNSTN